MKLFVRLTALCLIIFIMSCSKSDDNSTSTHTCDFSTPVASAPSDGTVKYEAKLTGTGQVTKIIIKTQSGDSTINSPGLPFQVTLPVNGGTALSISATGTTTGGTISLEYTFTNGGTEIKNENDCGN